MAFRDMFKATEYKQRVEELESMLTADSHSGEYDDILAGPGDEPVVCKGRVVWYMGERDERQ